jgi:two-component system, NarL family, response regulator
VKRLVSVRFDVVGVCHNGADAVHCVLKSKPDLVLLDVVMPILDGIQATRQIRAFDRTVKIIMVSGLEDLQIVKAAIEAGAQGYVFKRRISTDLIASVNAVLEGEALGEAIDPVPSVRDLLQ